MLRRTIEKAWPYIVAVRPSTMPLTVNEVKEHLKLNVDETAQDALLKILIRAATEFAERYTKRDFITRTYETFRDSFAGRLELRRNPIQSITKVEYLKSGTLTTVSSDVYFLISSNSYPHIALETGQVWPTDIDLREEVVKITFDAGYGNTLSSVPDSLREGLLQHIAAMYANRGDCDESSSAIDERLLPVASRLIYNMYRIRNI